MVSLSSPGVVAGRAEGKTRTVESMSLGSHVYNTLIAWFMSLVCMIMIKLGTFDWANSLIWYWSDVWQAKPSAEDSVTNTTPFWVTGLQQIWKNDSLVLYICAVPLKETRPSGTKSRVRITNPILLKMCLFGKYRYDI